MNGNPPSPESPEPSSDETTGNGPSSNDLDDKLWGLLESLPGIDNPLALALIAQRIDLLRIADRALIDLGYADCDPYDVIHAARFLAGEKED